MARLGRGRVPHRRDIAPRARRQPAPADRLRAARPPRAAQVLRPHLRGDGAQGGGRGGGRAGLIMLGAMSTRAWAGFLAMSTIWGVPYLFIKVAVDDGVPPAFLAWARVVLAAAVLLALAWRAGTFASLHGRGRWLLAFAVFEIAVPFPKTAKAS